MNHWKFQGTYSIHLSFFNPFQVGGWGNNNCAQGSGQIITRRKQKLMMLIISKFNLVH